MSNTPRLRYTVLILAILFSVGVLIFSIAPVNRIELGTRPGVGSTQALIERAAFLHFALHAVMYGILACISWLALDLFAAGAVNKMIVLIMILLLGWGTEYLQHRLYDNPIEMGDVLADILAASLAFGSLALWARYRKPPAQLPLEGEHVAYVLRDLD